MVEEPQESSTAAYLIIQEGPRAGKRLEIWKDLTTIGRSRDCDIFLEDISVHRKQAVLCGQSLVSYCVTITVKVIVL